MMADKAFTWDKWSELIKQTWMLFEFKVDSAAFS